MASLNRVELIGNLGKDPETRSLQNGGTVVSFSIACSESWKDKQTGERKERTEWINVVCFNEGLGKVGAQYLRKGSKVYVSGRFQTRKWQDQSGTDRYSTEVVMQAYGGELILLDSAKGGDREEAPRGNGGASNRHPPASAMDDLDDDVPFILGEGAF